MPTPMPIYSRHDLVWLSASGWAAARARALPEHASAIGLWQQQDWPAVVRRSDADAGPDEVCLGIALPPDPHGKKVRIALRARTCDVARTASPLALAQVVMQMTGHLSARLPAPLPAPLPALLPALLPDKWRENLSALAGDSAGLTIRMYGSAALQLVTGLAYVRPASDIDLLFYPATGTQLDCGVALLSQHAKGLPLDGEIVFPGGQAVAWKEWLATDAGNARVLVKHASGVRLASRDALLAALEPA